jgi:hypothetical protein
MGTCLVSTGYHDKNFLNKKCIAFYAMQSPQAKVFQKYQALSLGLNPALRHYPTPKSSEEINISVKVKTFLVASQNTLPLH